MRSAIFLTLTFFGLSCVLPVNAQTNLGTWAATGSLNTGRGGHTATLLNNGLVLVVGGSDSDGNALASAELYNPATGMFAATGNLNALRLWHSAAALPNGMVLVVGGYYVDGGNAVPVTSAELYDPVAGTFTNTGSLVAPARFLSTATLLASGKVLIAGGSDLNGNSLSSAELYDPASGTFTFTGSMNSQRQFHAATLLNNSKVLVTGGFDSSGNGLSSAELYDPMSGTFTTISAMNVTRFTHTSTLLNSGQVLIAGGYDLNFATLTSAELYDPVAGTFTLTGSLREGRGSPTVTLLNNGQALFVGGTDQGVNVAGAELYDPTAGTFAATANPATARYIQTATLLNNGTVLVAAGVTATGSTLSSAEIYTPPPGISSLSPTSGAVGARVTITGTNFGATQGTVTFGGTSATIQTWTPNSISVQVPGSLGPGSVQVVVNTSLASSDGLSFTVTSLTLSSLSLSSAPVGALIYLHGSGFGATQPTSTVTFNGTSATISSWSDGLISVSVPPGATTGNVVAQVDGAVSNPLVFTVVAASFPPSISATAFPSPNASNWNNTNVTISYTCSAGGNVTNGGVPLTQNSCAPPQTVATQGANQQVTGTVTDAGGNTASITTTFNIDETAPTVTITSPTDGTGFSSSGITISGTAVDSLSGLASVSCNGTVVPVTSGSFSCNISLNVGVNLVVIQATDTAGNMAGSTLHLTLTAPLPAATSLQITPGNANVLVGATQQFTAVDQLGIPRADATWTVDNSNIATISTDTSPILTGVAAGTVTLTASIASVSAQVQVHILGGASLPVGTILWSAPQVPGFTALQIIQAVPTSNGTPDLYSIEQDGNLNILIRALTGDGQQLWQTLLPATQGQFINQNTRAMGDSLGGLLIVVTDRGIIDLDGQRGTVAWQYTNNIPYPFRSASVGQDGFAYAPDYNGHLLKIDPQSGNGTVVYTSPQSVSVVQTGICFGAAGVIVSGSQSSVGFAIPTAPVIDANGSAFFTTSQSSSLTVPTCVDNNVDTGSQTTGSIQHSVVKLAPDGTATRINLPINGPLSSSNSLRVLAPDGNGGALVQWITGQYPSTSAYIMATSTGSVHPSPLPNGITQVVRSQNGAAFFTDGNSVAYSPSLSGPTQWTYQPSQGNVSSMIATFGGGLTLIDGSLNQTSLDSTGVPGTLVTGVNSTNPYALGAWASASTGQVSMLSGPPVILDGSNWPVYGGSLTGSGASPKLTVATFVPSPIAVTGDPRFGSDLNVIADLKSNIPPTVANNRIYTRTVGPFATIPNFVKENAPSQLDVVAFDGHAVVIAATPPFSAGMIFDGSALVRTPDCQTPALGLCYTVTLPEGSTYQTQNVILTSAKIIFVAQCDAGTVFTGWWDMNLNTGPQGRALIVPDLGTMAQLNHQPGLNPNGVDLEQGAVGWEALVKSLAAGNTAQTAVNAANSAIATYYATSSKTLAQVVLMVFGNGNVCPRCQ
jgi:Glucodextranase, domain B/IPT/TIG domain/Bacterial Ig-like domain (group 2)/Kelch motif/Galactose oxidase, central domain